MTNRTVTHCFLRILRVEIDDLLWDIGHMISRFEERFRNREISEHVYLENVGILKNEACSIRGFKQILDEVDPATVTSLEEIQGDLLARARERVRLHGLFPCATILLERKMEKVANYVTGAESDGNPSICREMRNAPAAS